MSEIEPKTYDYFWSLASLDVAVRQEAAKGLILHLSNLYGEHKESHASNLLQNEALEKSFKDSMNFVRLTEILKQQCGADIVYSLIRLTKGLTSSRQGARAGFALALTELLCILDFMTYKSIIPFIDEAASDKEQDSADILFGRVFGYMCIIRSGTLWRHKETDSDYKEVIDGLLFCSKQKHYVKCACYRLIISTLPHLRSTNFERNAVDYLLEKVFEHCKHGLQDSDDVDFALAMQEHFPDICDTSSQWKSIIIHKCEDCINQWKQPIILHKDNLVRLAETLEAKSKADDQNRGERIHPVWDRILKMYFKTEPQSDLSKKNSKNAPFSVFWRETVDKGLFAADSTHKRRFWGFQFFERALSMIPPEQVSMILTPQFMRTFTHHLLFKDRYLYKAARNTLGCIQNFADDHKKASQILVIHLLGENGTRHFDKQTRTKTVDEILSNMDAEDAMAYSKYLCTIILNKEESSGDRTEIDGNRQWAIDQMYALVKNHRIERQEEWLKFVLDFFLFHGFFTLKTDNWQEKSSKKVKLENGKSAQVLDDTNPLIRDAPSPELSSKTRVLCRTRFYNTLGELNNMKPFLDGSTIKSGRRLSGTMSDGQSWARYSVELVKNFEKNPKYEIIGGLSEEAKAVKKDAISLIDKIDKKVKKHTISQYRAFELLVSHTFLLLFSEPEEATTILQDLQECYNKQFRKTTSKGMKGNAEEVPGPVEVIIDILIGFLGKPSATLRHLSQQVFETFCNQLTETSLNLLLNVLETKEGAAGQEELYETMEIDEEEDDSESEVDNESEDDKEDYKKAVKVENNMSRSEDDDESRNESEVDNESEDDNKDYKKAVRVENNMSRSEDDDESRNESEVDNESEDDNKDYKKAVKVESNVSRRETTDDNDDDTDQSVMSDQEERMAEYDAKLAEIFKQKQLEKPKKKNAKFQVIHFKNKVLDLLKTFVRKQPNNPLMFQLVIPLLETVLKINTSTDQIAEKARGLINKLCMSKEVPQKFANSSITEILQEVHQLVKRAENPIGVASCSKASVYLVKALVKYHEKDQIDTSNTLRTVPELLEATDIYEASLRVFISRPRCHLNVELFTEFVTRFPVISCNLLDCLTEFTNPVNVPSAYRLVQAYELMLKIFKESSSKKLVDINNLLLNSMPRVQESFERTLIFAIGAKNDGKRLLKVEKLKEILRIVISLIRITKKIECDMKKTPTIWSTEILEAPLEAVKKFSMYESSPAIRDIINQLMEYLTGRKC